MQNCNFGQDCSRDKLTDGPCPVQTVGNKDHTWGTIISPTGRNFLGAGKFSNIWISITGIETIWPVTGSISPAPWNIILVTLSVVPVTGDLFPVKEIFFLSQENFPVTQGVLFYSLQEVFLVTWVFFLWQGMFFLLQEVLCALYEIYFLSQE